MVVCMSRRICVDLYDGDRASSGPTGHGDDDAGGAIKVVMTGSASDPLDWQQHIRNKPRREALAEAVPGPERPVPDRHRPRHVADRLRRAVPAHDVRRQADARARPDAGDRAREPRLPRQAGRPRRRLPRPRRRAASRRSRPTRRAAGQGETALDQAEAVALHAREVRDLLRPLPRLRLVALGDGHGARSGSSLLPAAQEHILAQEDGKDAAPRRPCAELSQAFALAVPHDEALAIRDDVGFFQAVRAVLAKSDAPASGQTDEELDHAIRQIVSRAVVVGRGRSTSSPRPGSRSPTSRSSRTSSSPRCATCRSGTSRSSCCGSSSTARSGRGRGGTSSRRAPSPSCSSRRSAGTRTAPIETAQVIEELIALAKEMREAERARRGARADRRRARLLRRARDERQRGEGPRRRRR